MEWNGIELMQIVVYVNCTRLQDRGTVGGRVGSFRGTVGVEGDNSR